MSRSERGTPASTTTCRRCYRCCPAVVDDLRTRPADETQPALVLAPGREQSLRGTEEAGRAPVARAATADRQTGQHRYTITPKGRRALAAWVRQPGEPAPTLEFEALVRVLSVQRVDVEDLREILEAVRDRPKK